MLYGAGGLALHYAPRSNKMDGVIGEYGGVETTYRVEKGMIKKREGITKWKEYDVVVGESGLNDCLRRFRKENPNSKLSTFRIIPVEGGTEAVEQKPFPFWLRKKNVYNGTNSTSTVIGPVMNQGLGIKG
jgi:hypothetical protein